MDRTKYKPVFEMKPLIKSCTYLAAVKAQDKAQQKLIMDLLGWDEFKWCRNQYNKGLEYLNIELDGDQFGLDMMVRSKAFWNYWKNEWAKRDALFLITCFEADTADFFGHEYQFIHSYQGIRSSKRIDLHEREMEAIWGMVFKERSYENV